MKRTIEKLTHLFALCIIAAGIAGAVPVVNWNFDDEVLVEGAAGVYACCPGSTGNTQLWQYSAQGWTGSGWDAQSGNGAGTWQASVFNSAFINPVSGLNIAFLEGVASLSQVLAAPAEANTPYTLTLQVGHLLNQPAALYSIELFSGSTQIGVVNGTTADITAGAFAPVTLMAMTGDTPGPLEIRISSSRVGGLTAQVALDNVTLTSAVPEPGTIALLGSGFAGLFLLRRRIAKK